MNDKIAIVIDKIAAKLGVGAEMLWGALLVQAKIDSAMGLVVVAFIFSFLLFLWKKCNLISDKYARESAQLAMVVFIGGGILLALNILYSVVTGFINPEYWALKQVIK